MLYLHDPLALSPQMACLPQALGYVLALFNGQRTVEEVQQMVRQETGFFMASEHIENLLSQLDSVYILDNDRSAMAKAEAIKTFRAQPFRKPTSAGRSYAADPDDLRQELQGYIDQSEPIKEINSGLGLISPHIDYMRGGPVYARAWQRAAKLAREAECVIVFGTDHNSILPSQMTLTRQDYATPFGILPTDQAAVDALVDVLGEQEIFAEELHHCQEWSIELVITWLHFIRNGESCVLVPILCSSFQHFIGNGGQPAEDKRLNAAIAAIKQATAGRRTLVVASGDLAHLGPAFNTAPIQAKDYARIKTDDDSMLSPIYAGDPDAFFEIIRRRKGKRNVCGTSPFYLALKLMGDVQGELTSYDRCPADPDNTSYVSVCGVVFH